MPQFNDIFAGFGNSLSLINIGIMFIGTAVGILFGSLPGLTAAMCIAVMIPITFGMNTVSGLLLLGSAYCGAIYGGSISAILLNIPGTSAAAATCIDGYPMARQGKSGEALGMAAFASWFGGTVSTICLLLFAPPIAKMALRFGPPEYTVLGVFGLSMVISVSINNPIKGLLAGVMGLLLGTLGMDPIQGFARFTFNSANLLDGIPLVPALIGLFSLSQLLLLAEEKTKAIMIVDNLSGKVIPTWSQIKSVLKILIRGSLIGTFIGALPGAGASIATFLSYNDAKRGSKKSHLFGTGIVEGVTATEVANNGVTGGSLIPMLTLGIPGNNVTAIMLGGLMILGLNQVPIFLLKVVR